MSAVRSGMPAIGMPAGASSSVRQKWWAATGIVMRNHRQLFDETEPNGEGASPRVDHGIDEHHRPG